MAVNGDHSAAHETREEVFGDVVAERIADLDIAASRVVEGERDGRGSREEEEEEEEEADVDDDESGVWGGGGLRGFVQKAEEEERWKISRQYFPSKAGGAPAWLDPTNLPRGQQIACGICDKPLQFVLQVYAPAEDDDMAFHRTVFVFACTSLACLQQDELQQRKKEKERWRSVKVFRSQLPRENPFYVSTPPISDGREPLRGEGAALCSWCGTWKGDKLCGGCKQTRYCSQPHQMDHWRSDHAAYCRQVQARLARSASETGGDSGDVTQTPSGEQHQAGSAQASTLWPEFELIVGGGGSDDEESDDDSDGNADSRRLLAEYDTRRNQGAEFSAKDVQDVEEASLEEQHWAFFESKISKSREQVLWYLRSAEAKPLWPRLAGQPKASDIPPCSVCGGERTFEFQILPQLLYFFQVKDTADSLDWGTIAIYSCARSCNIRGYSEEFAWVQPGFS